MSDSDESTGADDAYAGYMQLGGNVPSGLDEDELSEEEERVTARDVVDEVDIDRLVLDGLAAGGGHASPAGQGTTTSQVAAAAAAAGLSEAHAARMAHMALDASLPPRPASPPLLASSPSPRDIGELGADDVDTIRQTMAVLPPPPPEAVPDWARGVDERVWVSALMADLEGSLQGTSRPADDGALAPEGAAAAEGASAMSPSARTMTTTDGPDEPPTDFSSTSLFNDDPAGR